MVSAAWALSVRTMSGFMSCTLGTARGRRLLKHHGVTTRIVGLTWLTQHYVCFAPFTTCMKLLFWHCQTNINWSSEGVWTWTDGQAAAGLAWTGPGEWGVCWAMCKGTPSMFGPIDRTTSALRVLTELIMVGALPSPAHRAKSQPFLNHFSTISQWNLNEISMKKTCA